MSVWYLLPLGVAAVIFSGCASSQSQKEAKSQNDKVSLVIMPVIVVLPDQKANDGDSSPSRDDDSHPRTLLLRNLQYRVFPKIKHVPETTNSGR
jgi:hypothetical protein